MALPPLAGATNVTVIDVTPGAVVGFAGAVGTVAGTADPDADDSNESPSAFVA
jgi:hypothetical protein